MAFQPGDVINIARVAWDIYNWGWTDELRASTFPSPSLPAVSTRSSGLFRLHHPRQVSPPPQFDRGSAVAETDPDTKTAFLAVSKLPYQLNGNRFTSLTSHECRHPVRELRIRV